MTVEAPAREGRRPRHTMAREADSDRGLQLLRAQVDAERNRVAPVLWRRVNKLMARSGADGTDRHLMVVIPKPPSISYVVDDIRVVVVETRSGETWGMRLHERVLPDSFRDLSPGRLERWARRVAKMKDRPEVGTLPSRRGELAELVGFGYDQAHKRPGHPALTMDIAITRTRQGPWQIRSVNDNWRGGQAEMTYFAGKVLEMTREGRCLVLHSSKSSPRLPMAGSN